MRWSAKDPRDGWRPWFAWFPVNIDGEHVWMEWIERRFAGEYYEVRNVVR